MDIKPASWEDIEEVALADETAFVVLGHDVDDAHFLDFLATQTHPDFEPQVTREWWRCDGASAIGHSGSSRRWTPTVQGQAGAQPVTVVRVPQHLAE